VAEFIGTMNVVHGDIRGGALHFAGGVLPLRDGATAGSSEAMFRPEDLLLATAAGPMQFSGQVLASLFQGDHTRLEVDIGAGKAIVARIAQRRDFVIGERLTFTLSTPAIKVP
jgi:putative spermidine/putrescine transport system ATP-binding protein